MGNNKVKIFIFGRDKVGWSIDEDRKAVTYIFKKCGFLLTGNIFKATHIFCVWYDLLLNFRYRWLIYYSKLFNKKIIVVITNNITLYPYKVDLLKRFVDICISPSENILNFLKMQNLKVYKIPFFVNETIFKPLNISKQKICQKLGIDFNKIAKKIVIGSFQRDSLGNNLMKPKWQKNPDLLIDILEKLPREKYISLLAGPRRHYIMKKCKNKGIPFLFYGDSNYINNLEDDILINNLNLEIINLLYNLIDIYIVSSKSEGGPKQILESSLTKTLIFSTKVGFAPDIIHPELLFNDNHIQSVIKKIIKFYENPNEFNKYIEYNFKRSKQEVNIDVLKEKYRKVILEN